MIAYSRHQASEPSAYVKDCPKCDGVVPDTALSCRHCGADLSGAGPLYPPLSSQETLGTGPITERFWPLVVTSLVLVPVGLYLVWRHSRLTREVKWAWTGAVGVAVVCPLLISCLISPAPQATQRKAIARSRAAVSKGGRRSPVTGPGQSRSRSGQRRVMVPPVRDGRVRPGIGVSARSLAGDSRTGFTLERVPLANQQFSFTGRNANGLCLLEMTGEASNVSEVRLTARLPADRRATEYDPAALAARLLTTIDPTWTQSASWLTRSLNRTRRLGQPVTELRGTRAYTVLAPRRGRLFILFVARP